MTVKRIRGLLNLIVGTAFIAVLVLWNCTSAQAWLDAGSSSTDNSQYGNLDSSTKDNHSVKVKTDVHNVDAHVDQQNLDQGGKVGKIGGNVGGDVNSGNVGNMSGKDVGNVKVGGNVTGADANVGNLNTQNKMGNVGAGATGIQMGAGGRIGGGK